jgi:hypothetical protein
MCGCDCESGKREERREFVFHEVRRKHCSVVRRTVHSVGGLTGEMANKEVCHAVVVEAAMVLACLLRTMFNCQSAWGRNSKTKLC